MQFICYSRCSTCAKAQRWLDAEGIEYKLRDIKSDNPSIAELKRWWQASGLPLRRFFNTSGIQYRDLGLKDKLSAMDEDEQLKLLASDGMLVKRPLAVSDDGQIVLVGFKEADWAEKLH